MGLSLCLLPHGASRRYPIFSAEGAARGLGGARGPNSKSLNVMIIELLVWGGAKLFKLVIMILSGKDTESRVAKGQEALNEAILKALGVW